MQTTLRIALLGCALFLTLMNESASAEITAKKVLYHGWKGAYWLTNGTVELIFVPQIGRIMRYGYLGGPNILWDSMPTSRNGKIPAADGWINYGGDKLWPAPQKVWGWPPDPVMDRGLQKVTITPTKRLRVEGQVSPKHRLKFVREIALAPTGTGVTLTNTLINTGDSAAKWSVWEVTQVDSPDVVRLPFYSGLNFAEGYYTFADCAPEPGHLRIVGNEVQVKRGKKKASKIGGDSPLGWIVAEKNGLRFEVSAKVDAHRPYPDDGCALEIYTNPDPLPYIEMERLGPLVKIPSGGKATLVTHWNLSRKRPDTRKR